MRRVTERDIARLGGEDDAPFMEHASTLIGQPARSSAGGSSPPYRLLPGNESAISIRSIARTLVTATVVAILDLRRTGSCTTSSTGERLDDQACSSAFRASPLSEFARQITRS